jgi:hypothetical protein
MPKSIWRCVMSQEISPENQAIIENLHVLIARAEKEK